MCVCDQIMCIYIFIYFKKTFVVEMLQSSFFLFVTVQLFMTRGKNHGFLKEVLSLPKLMEVNLESQLVWDS